MFNIGFFELIILGVIGLVVLGPEELPQMARKAAKLLNEFKRMGEEIMSPVDDMKEEARQMLQKTRQELAAELVNKKTAEAENLGEPKHTSQADGAEPASVSNPKSNTDKKDQNG